MNFKRYYDRPTHVDDVRKEIVKNGGDLENLTEEQEEELALADCFDMMDAEMLCEMTCSWHDK